MPGLAPDCAACHVRKYNPNAHRKYLSPRPTNYTIGEVRDCSGACHLYSDNTLTTIKERRTGRHRVNRTQW